MVLPAAIDASAGAEELPTFAPLVLCEPEEPVKQEVSPQPDDLLRLAVCAAMIELAADTPARRIAELVRTL